MRWINERFKNADTDGFCNAFTAVSAFGETVRVIQIDLTYNGRTVQYREQEVSVIVDGKRLENLDMPAVIIDDRTLVPLRAIFESMGASVSWDGDTQKITADFENGDNIVMFINNKAGVANGNAFNMDVAPMIINDRTMVPVRSRGRGRRSGRRLGQRHKNGNGKFIHYRRGRLGGAGTAGQ